MARYRRGHSFMFSPPGGAEQSLGMCQSRARGRRWPTCSSARCVAAALQHGYKLLESLDCIDDGAVRQPVVAEPALTPPLHKPRISQYANRIRDRVLRDSQRKGKVPDAELRYRQQRANDTLTYWFAENGHEASGFIDALDVDERITNGCHPLRVYRVVMIDRILR